MTTTNGSFEGCVHPQWIGDSFCDDGNSNQGCDFDGGDCCGNYVKKHYCEKCECIDWDELPYYSFNGYCYHHPEKVRLRLLIYNVPLEVTKMEERYILSTTDFIGSVGGSLGLFLGFSIFTYTSDLLDKIFNRFC